MKPSLFPLSRRRALLLAVAGATAAATPWARATDLPIERAHAWRVLSRLGYGPTPALLAQVQRAGGPLAWASSEIDTAFAASHRAVRLDGLPGDFDAPLPTLFEHVAQERAARRERRDAQASAAMTMANEASSDSDPARYSARIVREAAVWRLAACSRPELDSPLLARTTEFWFNHLNVSADKGTVRPFAGHYAVHAIRAHALGRFEDLLLASARHPAMLYYLDQVQSVADGTVQGNQRRGLNENYARELMELHTLGAGSGYTQQDVRELARVLTGWTVGPRQDDGFRFAPRGHDTGAKTVLGRSFGGAGEAQSGEAEGIAAIRMLAAHPATARRIALRMAQWFVADQPPPALVEQLARAFQSSGGDTRAVLRTLVRSPAFLDPANTLFKTPFDYACSTLAACAGPQGEREINQALALLRGAGQGVLRWPTPDGYKVDRATWLAPEALTRRADWALQLARREPAVNFLTDFAQPATRRHIDAQPASMRAALLLASRDFMMK